eukprot:CAMPEP_0175955354 /NCGR_PEP_ID=MMETSP0108-20121206/32454_1 /TAXON_ID=195067 ORGANISM="Goniomonas pacifica, Strain CCMP1869" /NCGR_SAMPLE_ID=MMETSP0108 /ASSEMBLY_ACC=CAM_ASM_000204 /LENGTH=35 /DNA_ID= /DNA_START= /DNA_END= /DNA_ORIENTATION=
MKAFEVATTLDVVTQLPMRVSRVVGQATRCTTQTA